MKIFDGKSIFITGSCGTIGAELVTQLLSNPKYNPKEVIGIDNNESALFFQDQKFLDDSRVNFFVADIRDKGELSKRMRGANIVIHAAALKHVILCERSPEQAVQTNINGVQNVIAAADENNVDVVIFTSSDKAVNPTNVMGTTKLMGERLMTAANSSKREKGPIFASTRFGNVLGSNGSVIPIFRNQILNGGPVTLTDKNMTRFVMSVEEAVDLVLDSVIEAKGGEVFVTKMPVMRIEDLALAMIEELCSEEMDITEIGSKPGEKLYEELMSDEETRRAIELDKFFSIMPAFRGIYSDINYNYPSIVSELLEDPYVSEQQISLTVEKIKDFLSRNKLLLGSNDSEQITRYWPGDKEERF
ncbi:polysaccharide biosynthesis protein [Candidatus Pseudothioglobus singularis]|nr:polysaccharide biosynthesis protein [Candidatus Pseudothioglobus singularis]